MLGQHDMEDDMELAMEKNIEPMVIFCFEL